jgi:hypothetical protein
MFVEALVLDEDAEYRTQLANTITDQINSARDAIRTIDPTSSAFQVAGAMSGIVQSRVALSTSQYAETEPIVKSVTEVSVMSFRTRTALTCKQKLSEITNDLGLRIRPMFEKVANQNQEIVTLKTEVGDSARAWAISNRSRRLYD